MRMTLWGGRFTAATDKLMKQFNDSIGFDRRMYAADIRGSIAYAGAIARSGLITAEERDQLVAGLERVLAEFDAGDFEIQPSDEDIHTAVERRLGELVGTVAGKLHTGRSRNDQVATDLRLYLLDEMASLREMLIGLQEAIVQKSEAHLDVIMPGYTHLQQAQPLLFSHWLMSYFWKFQRDCERLTDVVRRTSVLPLGAGALAGNPFGIDRQALAAELGFDVVAENTLDVVSDRDYVVEFLMWAALVQIHLSGLAEDVILWASREFGFVQVDDAYSTGSSLMPQKRNPDSLELMRGKTGRMTGHLVGLMTTLKGLPSGYNKDLQEDKEIVFDAVDTLALELPIAAGVIGTLQVNGDRMQAALDDALLATDLADYLVRKGVPFRQSHHLAGQAVRRAEELGVPLGALTLADYQAIHPAFAEDVYQVFDFQRSVEMRDAEGGTAPSAVCAQIERAKRIIK
ncbi:MAG: argininosuccinate lyase [Chloroflexi bacterium]|nr:argininosuccinate lyase [Chloroflexota bacterium]